MLLIPVCVVLFGESARRRKLQVNVGFVSDS